MRSHLLTLIELMKEKGFFDEPALTIEEYCERDVELVIMADELYKEPKYIETYIQREPKTHPVNAARKR